jgi:uncharacterized protein HemX
MTRNDRRAPTMRTMSSVEQPPPSTPPEQAAHKHSVWLWVSLALVAVCVGLYIWGAGKSSDLNDAKADNAKSTATLTNAYEDVNQSLGQTNEQLDQANSDVTEAQTTAEQAQKDSADAQQAAAQASSDKAKADAQAKDAQARVDTAESKVEVAKSCAKAYASAIGSLLDGDDISAQLANVKQKIQGITADCKASLGGA